MSRPNLIINLPMDVDVFVRISQACPEGSVLVQADDPKQAHVYFDPANAPSRGQRTDEQEQMVADIERSERVRRG